MKKIPFECIIKNLHLCRARVNSSNFALRFTQGQEPLRNLYFEKKQCSKAAINTVTVSIFYTVYLCDHSRTHFRLCRSSRVRRQGGHPNLHHAISGVVHGAASISGKVGF